MVAICGSLRLNPLLLAVLAVAIAVAAGVDGRAEEARGETVPGMGVQLAAATCRPLDPCRVGVANEGCCKAIAAAIAADGGCACACKVLKSYGAPRLTVDCKNSWCSKCDRCACS